MSSPVPQQIELYNPFTLNNNINSNYNEIMNNQNNFYNRNLPDNNLNLNSNINLHGNNLASNFYNSNSDNVDDLIVPVSNNRNIDLGVNSSINSSMTLNLNNNNNQNTNNIQNFPSNFIYPMSNTHQKTNSADIDATSHLQYPPTLQPSHFPHKSYNYSNANNAYTNFNHAHHQQHHHHNHNSSISSIVSISNEPPSFPNDNINLNLNFSDLNDNFTNNNLSSFDQLSNSHSIHASPASSINSFSANAPGSNSNYNTPRRPRNTSISLQPFTTPRNPTNNSVTVTSPKISKTPIRRRHTRTRSRLSIDATNISLALASHTKSPSLNLNLGTNPFYTPPTFLSPKNIQPNNNGEHDGAEDTHLTTPLTATTASSLMDENQIQPPTYGIRPQMFIGKESSMGTSDGSGKKDDGVVDRSDLSPVEIDENNTSLRTVSAESKIGSILKIEDQEDNAIEQLKKKQASINSATMGSQNSLVSQVQLSDLTSSITEPSSKDIIEGEKSGTNNNIRSSLTTAGSVTSNTSEINMNENMFYAAADITLKLASQMSQNQLQNNHQFQQSHNQLNLNSQYLPQFHDSMDLNNFNMPYIFEDSYHSNNINHNSPAHSTHQQQLNYPPPSQPPQQHHLNYSPALQFQQQIPPHHFNYTSMPPQLLASSSSSSIIPSPPHMLQSQIISQLPLQPPPVKVTDKTSIPDKKKKNHQCQLCLAKFQRPEHVKRHMKSHSSEKPYHCDEPNCGKKFNRNDNLKAHLRKIHQRRI